MHRHTWELIHKFIVWVPSALITGYFFLLEIASSASNPIAKAWSDNQWVMLAAMTKAAYVLPWASVLLGLWIVVVLWSARQMRETAKLKSDPTHQARGLVVMIIERIRTVLGLRAVARVTASVETKVSRAGAIANERIPLLDLRNLAIGAGWPTDHQDAKWLDFTKALRQSAVDGLLNVWGRQNSSDVDELVANEPLLLIDKSHWIAFEIDTISMCSANKNLNVRTYNMRAHDWGKRDSYRDLHVSNGQAEQWLKNLPFRKGGASDE